ncbi:unnamed protein product, partial [Porites lobata]
GGRPVGVREIDVDARVVTSRRRTDAPASSGETLLLRGLATDLDEMKQEKVQFHKGLPTSEELDQWFGPTQGGLLVLDDLMDEGANDKRVLDLFSKHSHHRNISVLFLCQDLFPPGKFAKTISCNAHYIVAFKNPRDQVGMRTLTLQAFPNDWSHVMNIFRECTQRPFGYLMLDLHPASDDRYRLFTNVMSHGPYQKKYLVSPADMERLVEQYKGTLMVNSRLTHAARLAAKQHVLLASPEIPPATKKIRVKALGPAVRRATRRVRTMSLPGAGGAVAGADDDDEFAQGPMETFLKTLIKSSTPQPKATP